MNPEALLKLQFVAGGRYPLTRVLGRGGFGAVYEANETAPDGTVARQCALKILWLDEGEAAAPGTTAEERTAARKASASREIAAMAAIDHRGFLRILNWGLDEDSVFGEFIYIAMELARGTLRERLTRERRALGGEEARSLAREVGEALAHAHRRGLVHRDLKPENVFRVGEEESARWSLGDLGLARGFERNVTRASAVAGTALYMPPEALDFANPRTGPAVDVWALGVLLHESLTLSFPFAGSTDDEIMRSVVAGRVRVSPNVPEPFRAVIHGCLVAEAENRWTAAQVVAALGGQAAVAVSAAPERRTSQAAAGTPRVVVRPPPPSSSLLVRFNAPMVRCPPAGSPPFVFTMGSSSQGDNRPHDVTLTRAFEIGKYPVTQGLYAAVMSGVPGAYVDPSYFKGPRRPVEQVSWHDAVAFCNKLSALDGLRAAYSGSGDSVSCNWSASGYRLPTEAEWEYACRAGTSRKRYRRLEKIGWYAENAESGTHDVGDPGKAPNKWGLHDTIGNVWEWCWDWYASVRPSDPDPHGPASAQDRVNRGGSWFNSADFASASYRSHWNPGARHIHLGFRLSRTL